MKKGLIAILLVLIIVIAYVVYALTRPLPTVKPTLLNLNRFTTATSSKLVWPDVQSALALKNSQVFVTNQSSTPLPTASTAKLITALMVLKAKPLALGQTGPIITLGPSDVAIYNNYKAEQGSVVAVVNGEQISEYQMLQAMLLPSANNIADSLAIWAYGSLANYSVAANSFLKSNGLIDTHVGVDASGFDPSTTSTATNLVGIGRLILDNPLLANIVSQTSASGIPVVGTVFNVNILLGKDGIVGIKTGNNNQDKGVFVGAANVDIDGRTDTIITSVLGSSSLVDALNTSQTLLKSAQQNIYKVRLVPAGTVLAKYVLPWNDQTVPIVVDGPVTVNAFGGNDIGFKAVAIKSASFPLSANSVVGKASLSPSGLINLSQVNLKVETSFSKPSYIWRLLHAF